MLASIAILSDSVRKHKVGKVSWRELAGYGFDPKLLQSLVATADQKPSLPRNEKGLTTGLCLSVKERRDRSPRAGEALI